MDKVIASDAAKAQGISRTTLPPTRIRSARNRPLKYDNCVIAQAIKNVPTNATKHAINNKLIAQDNHEVAIWGVLMTQYRLKAGL